MCEDYDIANQHSFKSDIILSFFIRFVNSKFDG